MSLVPHGARCSIAYFQQTVGPADHEPGRMPRFRRRVADYPERIGCPVAAIALARPEDPELAAVATAAFQSWERPIAAALRDEGVGVRDAETFAGLVVSTVEGALLRARAAGSQEPLDSAMGGLGQALDRLLDEVS